MEQFTIKRRKHPEPEDEGWLITFADMSVLLMSFFILMWALSTTSPRQMASVVKSQNEQGFHNDAIPLVEPAEQLKKQLSLAIGQQGYDQYIATNDTLHGFDVELASSAFFESGSAKFSSKALPMLELVAKQITPLAKHDVMVEVEGHTDDAPVATEQFPSNWELSAARAANVVRYLIAKGFPPEKLRAVGRGETQPKAPNRDATGNAIPTNQNLNRRVIIKIIRGEDN